MFCPLEVKTCTPPSQDSVISAATGGNAQQQKQLVTGEVFDSKK